MRCKRIVGPLLLLLAFQATSACAQETEAPRREGVPLTITLAPDSVHHPIRAVEAYQLPDTVLIGSAEVRPDGYQKLVGYVLPDTIDGRYRFLLVTRIGGQGSRSESLSFDPVDSCTESDALDAGEIKRLTCSVVKRGLSLVCSAYYVGMEEPVPECGSHQCIYCQRIRICGSNPVCDD